MRDRLIKMIDQKQVYGVDQEQPRKNELQLLDNNELADYLLACGVIVPKAKIGDTIYILGGGRVREEKVKKICIHSNGLTYAFDWRGMGYEWVSDTDFGKTVFLNREEAERTLKGADDGKAD